MHTSVRIELQDARYALLRSFRRDGAPVDTPIWFALDGDALLFRTKVGPKTKRLATRPDVELTICDYRGRVRPGATQATGQATVLAGDDAERANRQLLRLAVEHLAALEDSGSDQR